MAGALPSPALCLITDETRSLEDNERTIRAALDAGCRWIQLRHRRIDARSLHDCAQRLRTLTLEYEATLIVNERVDIAVAVGADGAHLPAGGLSPAMARTLVGNDKLLGCSVHSSDEIQALRNEAVDYFQFGPIFDTASKRAFGPPQGLDALTRAVRAAAPLALAAVGGITPHSIGDVLGAGATAISVIGAIHRASDVATQTTRLLRAFD